MGVSKAQMNSVKKYNAKAYYRPAVCLKRKYEEQLRVKANEQGKTVSKYIQDLILNDLGIEESESESE